MSIVSNKQSLFMCGANAGLERFTAETVVNEIFARGLPVVMDLSWATKLTEIPDEIPADFELLSSTGKRRRVFTGAVSGPLTYLHLSNGKVYLKVAGLTKAWVLDKVADMKRLIPELTLDKPTTVPISFWTNGPHGPEQRVRNLTIPPFADIKGNYPKGIADALDQMITGFTPGAGNLMLWHGEPGTGKTFALRSLIGEWRAWCKPHYIIDPDQFFGSDANYMMSVLMTEDEDSSRQGPFVDPDDADADDSDNTHSNRLWKLLILEDTGGMLTQDAKQQVGQGLSRLLNVVDGLIGQGLRLMVLITTNESLKKMHPAVIRPGRCSHSLEFGPMSKAEAGRWLTDKNHPHIVQEPMSLAELFSLTGTGQVIIQAGGKSMGFAA